MAVFIRIKRPKNFSLTFLLWLSGSYLYIETSPRSYGDKARLEFRLPSSEVGKVSCLTFYYHMYGDTINSLNVYSGNSKIFYKYKNQGNVWLKAKMSLTLQRKVSCIILSGLQATLIWESN